MAENAKVRVTIMGPNLNDRKYAMHVHAEGCADLRHYGRGRKYGGDNGYRWTVEVANLLDLAKDLYADHVYGDNGMEDGPEADAMLLDYMSDTKVFACVKWPGAKKAKKGNGELADTPKTLAAEGRSKAAYKAWETRRANAAAKAAAKLAEEMLAEEAAK